MPTSNEVIKSCEDGELKGKIRHYLSLAKDFKYCDLLTLHPPQPSFIALVPRPHGGVLQGGLPLWSSKPLNSKLPLLKGPIVFTRGKLGQKVYNHYFVFNRQP